jgi:hypothetical protein
VKRKGGPVRASADGFVIDLPDDEAALVRRLIGELRALLTDPEPDSEARVLIVRLFPVVHPDDPDEEAEYQRLMRDELVQSKLAAFDLVDIMLGGESGQRARSGKHASVDEGRLIAFMQSVNSLRLVLGTMLGVSDDPAIDEVADGLDETAEYQLYAYLSWLLEHCVRALSGA